MSSLIILKRSVSSSRLRLIKSSERETIAREPTRPPQLQLAAFTHGAAEVFCGGIITDLYCVGVTTAEAASLQHTGYFYTPNTS